MNDEQLRLSLIELMNNNLLNLFCNKIFNYKLKESEYIYIQYKIVKNNIVLNIFDNNKNNRFKSYIFTYNIEEENENNYIKYINIKKCYNLYINKKTCKKIYLLGALLFANDNTIKKEIIESLFKNVYIKYILYKHFIS